MMLRKYLTKTVFCNIVNCTKLPVRGSALFINGPKATETFVYVTPHIDIERIKCKQTVQNEIARRKSNFDIDKLASLWEVFEELKHRKSELDKKKSEVSRELGKLLKTDPNSDAANKYKIQSDLIKENIKNLKAPLWSAEENAMVEALKLPNTVHSLTPDTNTVYYTHLSPPQSQEKNRKDHLKIGNELDIINFEKNENYYLKGDAALFELGAKFYFSDLLRKKGFIQFSNPDFVKSVIVEGCGEDHTHPDKTFILHHNEDSKVNMDSRLHLSGGGSLCSFMAYHTKNVILSKLMPLKYFSMGRQYIPAPSDEDSLFHVSQSSVVQMFVASRHSDEMDKVLGEITNILKEAYTELGYHFQLSYISADKLTNSESLRLSVEMYSPSLERYVEIGYVSVSGDYISKRLMFTYMDKKESKFPHIISGTLLNVPKFLACVLEQEQSFAMPKQFQVANWSL